MRSGAITNPLHAGAELPTLFTPRLRDDMLSVSLRFGRFSMQLLYRAGDGELIRAEPVRAPAAAS
jgi:hypothetical protein